MPGVRSVSFLVAGAEGRLANEGCNLARKTLCCPVETDETKRGSAQLVSPDTDT